MIVLVVLVFASYYGTGVVTERTLKHDVTVLNQSGNLHVEIEQYKRGWFNSTGSLKWEYHAPERVVKNDQGQSTIVPAQDFSLTMPLEIFHGPVIYLQSGVKFGLGYAKSELTLPEPFAQKFVEQFSSQSVMPKAEVGVLVTYLNNTELQFNVPGFTVIGKKENEKFEWLGMTKKIQANSDLSAVEGSFSVKGIKAHKDKQNIDMGQISGNYAIHETDEGLYLGKMKFLFSSLLVSNGEQPQLELDSFKFRTKSDVDDGLVNSSLDISIEKLFANGKNYGPGELKLSLENLDAEALSRINKQADQLQNGTKQQRQQAMFALLPELPKLLGQGAKFELSKLYFALPEGVIDGQLSISLPKGDTSNPFQLIQKIKGNGKLKLPKPMVQDVLTQSARKQLMAQPNLQEVLVNQMQAQKSQDANVSNTETATNEQILKQVPTVADINQVASKKADKKLKDLISSGILSAQGNDLSIELKLVDGQFTVNGKPFNPGLFKF